MSEEPSLGDQHLAFWAAELVDPSFVYVIRGDDDGPIKIGVARDVPARMRTLQTGNPQLLRLLHVVPGSYPLEHEFHHRLRGSEVRGEWFHGPPVDGFLAWVEHYSVRAVREYQATGKLPTPAPHAKKLNRTDVSSTGWEAKLGHKWRTVAGKDQAPIEVRFAAPDPRPSSQKSLEAGERLRRAGYTYDGQGWRAPAQQRS